MTDHNDDVDAAGATEKAQNNARSSTDGSPHPPNTSGQSPDAPPKKKRKVNHACVYCRRSHMTCDSDRPCKRCIKRNIGHLCHDEPREAAHRKSKGSETDVVGHNESSSHPEFGGEAGIIGAITGTDMSTNIIPGNGIDVPPTASSALPVSSALAQPSGLNGSSSNRLNYQDQWIGNQNQIQDMHRYHPNYMFNANEVTDEYNLLNDFLSTSLYDETGMFSTEDMTAYNDPSFMNSLNVSLSSANQDLGGSNPMSTTLQQALPTSLQAAAAVTQTGASKPASDKAREKYYMTAADPSGTDPPEERMNKLLKAKYDAGMLKPFNYVNGYARLNKFMEKHMRSSSRHKILMQLDRFRPKFRERMQSLTDIELVFAEMWFERSLMEYDRVFASMAIPACCWRRTGEIFRGNKEMAELIHVPIESLREVCALFSRARCSQLISSTGEACDTRLHS